MKKTITVLIVLISFSVLKSNMADSQALSPVPAGNQAVYFSFGLDRYRMGHKKKI